MVDSQWIDEEREREMINGQIYLQVDVCRYRYSGISVIIYYVFFCKVLSFKILLIKIMEFKRNNLYNLNVMLFCNKSIKKNINIFIIKVVLVIEKIIWIIQ